MDETKIQKLNTMKPLMMTVDLNVEGKDGRIVQGVEYIVGVKAYNRLVDSTTLPEVVEYPLKEMNKITRKAKWRAGELKFFKALADIRPVLIVRQRAPHIAHGMEVISLHIRLVHRLQHIVDFSGPFSGP